MGCTLKGVLHANEVSSYKIGWLQIPAHNARKHILSLNVNLSKNEGKIDNKRRREKILADGLNSMFSYCILCKVQGKPSFPRSPDILA